MKRVQHEAAITCNIRDQGNAEKSSATSLRKSYLASPAMRYGLLPRDSFSAGGASEANHFFDQDQDTVEKRSESFTEKNWHISPAKFPEDSPESSSMKATNDTLILPDGGSTESSKRSPRNAYQGSPAIRYRAWSEQSSSTIDGVERSSEFQSEKPSTETQSEKPSTEKIISTIVIGASEPDRVPQQPAEHRSTPTLFEESDWCLVGTNDHASVENQSYFIPGNCPHPYFDFPRQHAELFLKEPVEETQEPLENAPSCWQDSEAESQSGGEAESRAYVRKSALDVLQDSAQEAAQQQALLEEEFKSALTRGQFAAIANIFTRMQKMEAESQAKITGEITKNVQYIAVIALLRGLVDEYSKHSFQLELQKLLIDARKLQKQSSGNRKIVPGRCELCRSVQEKVLASIDIPKATTISVWKMVGAFAHKKDVVWHLSVLDELLALPANSNLKAALDCRVEGHPESTPAQLFQPLRTFRSVVAY